MSLQPYTKEWLEELCKDSYSYAEVLKKAGRKQAGGSQQTLKNKIQEFNIDISHFKGQGWNKGLKFDYKSEHTFEEIFTKNSQVSQKCVRTYVKNFQIIPYQCNICQCDGNWQGGKISLELHHCDGDNKNNEIENLIFLCPNCHALTENYRGKNKNNAFKPIEEEAFVKALREAPNIRQALISLGLAPKGGNYTRAKSLMDKYGIQK